MTDDRRNWARYLSMGFQIAATIGFGIVLGRGLDSWLETRLPFFTLGLALLSIVIALYQLFRDFGK